MLTVTAFGALVALLLFALAWSRRTRPAAGAFATVAGLLTLLLGASLALRFGGVMAGSLLDTTTVSLGVAALTLLLVYWRSGLLGPREIGFREVFEAMHEAALVVAPDGVVVEANPAALRLLGERDANAVRGEALLALAPQLEGARRATSRTGAPRPLTGDLEGFEASVSHLRDERRRLTASVMLIHDERLDRLREQRLASAASHDALTGVRNRSGFETALRDALAAHQSRALGLLYIDLDGFKAVNDSHGHACGDAVLIETARRLQGASRNGDVIGRLGGDEFGLLLPGVTPTGLAGAAARVRAAVSEPIHIGSLTVTVGASLGLAAAPHDGTDADALLRVADSRMYREKCAQPGRARANAADGSSAQTVAAAKTVAAPLAAAPNITPESPSRT